MFLTILYTCFWKLQHCLNELNWKYNVKTQGSLKPSLIEIRESIREEEGDREEQCRGERGRLRECVQEREKERERAFAFSLGVFIRGLGSRKISARGEGIALSELPVFSLRASL